jgi:phospholipid transport system substrate-binding protein
MICNDKENSQRTYRGFLFLVIFLGAVFLPFSGMAVQQAPSEVINKLNTVLLESMKKGNTLGYEGRYRLLAPVIKDSFAISLMARIASGKYWGTFSEEERKVYLRTYADWSVASYAGRFNEYSGQQFRLISESAPERGTVTVLSKLIDRNKDEVEFNYQFRQVEGTWRIVDIKILGVSQLALTRVQFVSILGAKGFQGLISMLNGKIRDLSQVTDNGKAFGRAINPVSGQFPASAASLSDFGTYAFSCRGSQSPTGSRTRLALPASVLHYFN